MLRLPNLVPDNVRRAVCSAPLEFPSVLQALAESLCASFDAVSSVVSAAARGSSFVRTGGHNAPMLRDAWNVIDESVQADLSERTAPVSFSSFNWPFAHRAELQLPPSYSLFVPFSSKFIVVLERESEFSGYVALFFDRFPELTDDVVQLIVTLPVTLSEVLSATLRAQNLERDERLGAYAHDVKHYLMVHEDLCRSFRDRRESLNIPRILEKMEKAQKRILVETNSVLLADKDDAGTLRVIPMKLCLNELVSEAAQELKPLFDASQATLTLELHPSLPESNIDPAIFPSVIHNLLDNALKYSSDPNEVLLRTFVTDKGCPALEVRNSGNGLGSVESEKIFERYYRAPNAVGKPGHGLGLYLARRVARAHQGDVMLGARGERATSFVVELPALGGEV